MSLESSLPLAQQARSRETERRILDAALNILTKEGGDAFSAARVSELAGVSVGSIYNRFGNTDQLLSAAHRKFTQTFREDLAHRLDSAAPEQLASPVELISHATASLARTFEHHAKAVKMVMTLGMRNATILAEGHQAGIEAGKLFAEFVFQAADAVQRPDVSNAIDYCYRLVYAACVHRLTHGPNLESSRRLGWKRFINELCETICAYLLTAPLCQGNAGRDR